MFYFWLFIKTTFLIIMSVNFQLLLSIQINKQTSFGKSISNVEITISCEDDHVIYCQTSAKYFAAILVSFSRPRLRDLKSHVWRIGRGGVFRFQSQAKIARVKIKHQFEQVYKVPSHCRVFQFCCVYNTLSFRLVKWCAKRKATRNNIL